SGVAALTAHRRGGLGAGVDVTVVAGLVAALADVYLQRGRRPPPQRPEPARREHAREVRTARCRAGIHGVTRGSGGGRLEDANLHDLATGGAGNALADGEERGIRA